MRQSWFRFSKEIRAKAKAQNKALVGVSTPDCEAFNAVDPIVGHCVSYIFLGMSRGMGFDRAIRLVRESLNENGTRLLAEYGKDYQEHDPRVKDDTTATANQP